MADRSICFLTMMMVFSGVSLASVALFDEGHGQRWPMASCEFFSEARDLLAVAGHELRILDGMIDGNALEGIDLFFTGTIEMHYKDSELDALHDFVTSGGTVWISHDGGGDSNYYMESINTFLAPYGMAMATTCSHSSGVSLSDFNANCVTEGIGTVTLDFVRLLTLIESPAQDLTIGPLEILAIYENEAGGSVFVMGDDNPWVNEDFVSDSHLGDADNATLLLNIFACAENNTSTLLRSFSAVKSLYR